MRPLSVPTMEVMLILSEGTDMVVLYKVIMSFLFSEEDDGDLLNARPRRMISKGVATTSKYSICSINTPRGIKVGGRINA